MYIVTLSWPTRTVQAPNSSLRLPIGIVPCTPRAVPTPSQLAGQFERSLALFDVVSNRAGSFFVPNCLIDDALYLCDRVRRKLEHEGCRRSLSGRLAVREFLVLPFVHYSQGGSG
jgi:hypothetical protein